jgi:hypothetical protein
MFEKVALRLFGVFIAGESIMNMNNSTNIYIYKIKIVAGRVYLDHEKLYDENTGDKNLLTLSL